MAKQKMMHSESDTSVMTPYDEAAPHAESAHGEKSHPVEGEYDRSHMQKVEREKHDAKVAEEKLEREKRKGVMKTPKHSMQLRSGKTLVAGQETDLTESELEEIKAGHPQTHENFFH